MAKGYRAHVKPKSVQTPVGKDATLIDIAEVKHQAEDFFEKNRNLILGGLIGVVILVGGWLSYKFLYQEPQNKEALEQMYQAEFLFEKDSFALALENPGGGFAGFAEIADQFGGTPAGNLAKYYAGICCMQLRRFEEARSYFEDFNAGGKVMPTLKNGMLGDVHAELNDIDKALEFYEKAASGTENELLTPVYLKKIGVLKQKQGDNAGALLAFKTIKEKFPNSPDGNGIDKFIIPLE
ncbi:MAG: tetratricopeptide repeat protein [Saprospiraceae bacterium]|jgi:tetratricopeptide (TPR) repeat protein|nr:tetratricopeptide repeat protein [Saprospiraceae bacterium]MBP9210841.1 tetratricopeptide repeat protein [Saprospiraceae bacterium]